MATTQDDDDALALKESLGDSPYGGRGTDAPTAGTLPVREGAGAVPETPAAAAPSQWQPSVFQGFTPKHAMEGFAFDREQNTGKSAKDAFAFLSNEAPPPPIQDKAALGAWFNQYIKPGMDALGHKVTNVEGDKFGFENWQGKFNVDYGRGAGAEGGALAWQVDDPSAVMSNQAYAPQQQQGNPALAAAIGGGDDDAQKRLQAELDAIINGQASPVDQQALLEQLQV